MDTTSIVSMLEKNKQTIINLYNNGLLIRQIAVNYNCGEKAITNALNRWGVQKRGRGKLWQYQDELLKLYNEGWNSNQLAKKYGVDKNKIRLWAKRNNLPGFSHIPKGLSRKYTVDTHFFDNINTEEKAYILGLFYSDGCVMPKYKRVNINMQDLDVIKKVKKALNYTGIINVKIQKSNNKKIYSLMITSEELMKGLINKGCIPKKSLILKWPYNIIPDNLIKHFIRGILDGDGYIGKYTNTQKGRIGIIGTKEICDGIKDFLGIGNVNLNWGANKNTYSWTVGNQLEVNCVLDLLYKDATIYMDRKYTKAMEILACG